MGDSLGDIGCMGCDLCSNDAFFYIGCIGQTQMLGRRYVAEEGCAGSGSDGSADSSRNVVCSAGHFDY